MDSIVAFTECSGPGCPRKVRNKYNADAWYCCAPCMIVGEGIFPSTAVVRHSEDCDHRAAERGVYTGTAASGDVDKAT